ncbi:MAG: acetyltransferase [Candidatus Poseidoniales archaeon]|nr:acetyltransferase [Candidatus Poseidoniales archaeon]
MTSSTPVLILGAGYQGKVLYDLFSESGRTVLGFLDDDLERIGSLHVGLPVLGSRDSVDAVVSELEGAGSGVELALAIGSNEARQDAYEFCMDQGFPISQAIHPTAFVAGTAIVGPALQMMAGAQVGAFSHVGANVIINSAASVDHDNRIEDHVSIYPKAVLNGRVVVEQGAYVGSGAVVLPGITIGERAYVGAGAVVTRDVPPDTTVSGVPARVH